MWEKATRHELGAGLDGGQVSPRCSSMTSSWKKGMNAARDKLLAVAARVVLDAGAAISSRAGGVTAMPRCEEEHEDMNHRVSQCRANTRETFDKTKHLVPKATQPRHSLDCFLLRGVVSRSWTLQDTKPGSWRQFGSGVLTEACTCIFGDGSGTHSDPRVRRVGWAAVVI